MIRRVEVHTYIPWNTLLCLYLLSVAAKREIQEISGRPASSSGRQPPMVADRPSVGNLFKGFLRWSGSSLEFGVMFRDQSKVQIEATDGKLVDF